MEGTAPALALGITSQRPPILSLENRILKGVSLQGGSPSIAYQSLVLPCSLRKLTIDHLGALPCPLMLTKEVSGAADTRNRLLGMGPLLDINRTQTFGGPMLPTTSMAPDPSPVTSRKVSEACTVISPGMYEPEKESEDLLDTSAAMPDYDLQLAETELGPSGAAEGPEFSQCLPDLEEQLNEKKLALINAVCCSLVESPKFEDLEDPTRQALLRLAEEVAKDDPEFLLKVALYTRQELNIRSTANFLLALAAWIPASRPHLRRYFCAAMQLPADWLQVPKIYQSLAGQAAKPFSLPSCLRRGMEDKFRQFNEYQLAKYNTRKQRSKHITRKRKTPAQLSRKQKLQFRSLRNQEATSHLQEFTEKLGFLSSQQKQKSGPKPELFSMKKLIQRLHITKPANHVMALLGCRYPSDLASFSRSGLPGPWDSRLSGKRMKLKQPETWERELSLRGNVSAVWEELIDHRKLPFMAMLRNLRNIIKAGISPQHHDKVIARLQDKESVIRSRQFPFRFLSAYKVILELEAESKKAGNIPTNQELLKKIFNKQVLRSSYTYRSLCGDERWDKKWQRAAMMVPVVYRLVQQAKKKLRSACSDVALLNRYRQALEAAIHISARHNVPPLPGRTLIFCCVDVLMKQPYQKAKDLCCPGAPGGGDPGQNTPITVLEMALLLSLMVRGASEQTRLVLYSGSACEEASVDSGSVLESVGTVLEQIERDYEKWNSEKEPQYYPLTQYLQDLVTRKEQVDTFLMLSLHPPDATFTSALRLYRLRINANGLFISILPEAPSKEDTVPFQDRNDVTLCGFNEQVLRFIAERGGARLLQHVEKIDEIYRIPKEEGALRRGRTVESLSHPGAYVPKLRWRRVRIFISSTFRDMHGERDILIRWVFPALRARAAHHYLSLEEIDLRWGVTEEDTQKNRQLSLCLSEVSRCQLFLGILGERYGYVPNEYSVPDVPEHRWVRSYPKGRSVTELEIMQFQNQDSSINPPRAFFYLRDPAFLRSVPDCCHKDFAAESPDAEKRMAELKSRVVELRQATCRRYSCHWGGIVDGKTFVQGLDVFGTMVLQDIWEAIEKNFIKAQPVEEEEETIQEAYQEYQQRQFCARKKQLLSLDGEERWPGKPQEGRVILVTGGPSEGKTVFMAALVHKLRCADQGAKSQQGSASPCNVIFHFTDAEPDARNVVLMLTRVCSLLSKRLKREGEAPRSYRGLVQEFESLLQLVSQSLRGGQTLTLLVDGADRLCGESGKPSSDWIPEFLPRRVQLVLSLDEGSSLQCSLSRRRDVSTLLLGPLEPSDRAEVVRQALAIYGKKLEESAFNNQMRLLLIKKGSQKPLYLKLASEDLRAFAVYEKVSGRIQSFPRTLPPLLQHILGSLEQEHGAETVILALSALLLSRTGLRERDLYAVLCARVELASQPRPLSWEEVLTAMEQQEATLPMAAFSYLLRSFQCMLGLQAPTHASDPRLQLSGSLLRDAVEQRYLGRPGLEAEVHLFLATYFWRNSDPQREDPARNMDTESLCALPYHLVHCGHKDLLSMLLTDLRFLSLHTELGQLPHLCEVYSLYSATVADDGDCGASPPPAPEVDVYREFAQRNATFLSRYPLLFLQQVLNEPEASPICREAQKLLGKGGGGLLTPGGGLRLMKWVNRPETLRKVNSKVMPIPSTPSCVGISSSGRTAAVGTGEGSLYLLDLDSGQVVRSLATSSDGISACVFLSEGSLCTASFNGKLEMWNIQDGCRLFLIEAHRREISSCTRSPDGKFLVSVSLDHRLKLWDSSRGTLVGSWFSSHPLNCVTFHPEGQLVAVGSWDKLICVLKCFTWELVSTLSGHSSTVRELSFSPVGNVLASAALDGEVRLWAWRDRVLLAAFQAHHGAAEVVRFVGHGQYLVTAGEDHKVQVWSGHLGQMMRSYGTECNSPALSVSLSPEGSMLAVGHQSECVKIYNLHEGCQTAECDVGDSAVLSLLWLQEGFLATAGSDKAVHLWEVLGCQATGRGVCEGHEGAVLSLAYSNGVLASTSDDCCVLLWSLRLPLCDQKEGPMSPIAALHGHAAGVTCCAFSPDGQYLATGSKDRSLLFWDVSASPPSLTREMLACHRDWVTGCAWTTASQLLSCSNDCTVCLWDPLSGQHLKEFLGHKSAVSSVLTVGGLVVSSSRDGVLKVWNWEGVELTSIPAHRSQINQCTSARTLSEVTAEWKESDLQVITAGADGSCKLWSPLLVEQVATLTGHSAGVCAAAATWGVHSFLTVARDCTLRLWPLPPYEGGGVTRQHHGRVTAVAWSPDGELAVSASDCGDVVIWSGARALDTLQVSKCAVRAVLFTSPRSFLVASDDRKVSCWHLDYRPGCEPILPSQRYSLDTNCLVTGMGLTPSSYVMLGTVGGILLILQPEKGHLHPVSCTVGYQPEVFYSQVTAMAGYQTCLLENSQNPALHLVRMTQAGNCEAQVLVDLGACKATERLHWITQTDPKFGFADSGGRLWVETRRAEKRDFDRDQWDVEFVSRKKKRMKFSEKARDLSVQEVQSWDRKQIHNDVITALHVLKDLLITASLDRDVKVWDRQSLKQLGLFRCDGSVSCLQPSPRSPSEIICGDTLGNVYFFTSL